MSEGARRATARAVESAAACNCARACDAQARVRVVQGARPHPGTGLRLLGEWGCPPGRVQEALIRVFCDGAPPRG